MQIFMRNVACIYDLHMIAQDTHMFIFLGIMTSTSSTFEAIESVRVSSLC
jgi:hypothetical protein